MLRRASTLMTGLLAALLLAPHAVAQEATTPASVSNPPINVQIFRPATHYGDLFTVSGSDIADSHYYHAGALFHFGKNPLVFVEPTDRRHELIQEQLTLDLFGGYSLEEWWIDIGLALPVHLMNQGEVEGFAQQGIDTEAISGFALGDARLSIKQKILEREEGADGLGVGFDWLFVLPTGDSDSFVSDGFVFAPTALVDWRIGPLLLVANSGYSLRSDESIIFDNNLYLRTGSEAFWRLGGAYDLIGEERAAIETLGFELQLIAELQGTIAGEDHANSDRMETAFGAKAHWPDLGVHATLGGGSGIVSGYGNTKFRMFFGAGWSPVHSRDNDQDGLFDERDECPAEPEDKDGHEDEDGCPDPDNDGDGILDGPDDCPNDAEDKDGFDDADGCPDPDNDGDGLNDSEDQCIDEPEDKDGFKDEDGCPEPDNDEDGVPDVADSCPLKPETKNGYQDDDGCPDQTLAKVEKGKIVILDKIYFESGKDVIKEESFPVLKAVAGILRANSEIRVRIEGHTDDKGSDKRNLKLSQARSEAVRAFLVGEGVVESRLEAQGLGEERPAVEGKTKEARAANRRVEFQILE